MQLKVGELFVGAGGLSLGFILANHPKVQFQPIFAIDNDKCALNTYEQNLQWLSENAPDVLPSIPATFRRDIETLNTDALLRLNKINKCELDILIGGPPCQGYSSSNKSNKENNKTANNKLMKVFLDKVDEFRPKMFLIENVQGVRWTKPTEEMTNDPIKTDLFDEVEEDPSNVIEFLVKKAKRLGYYVWYDLLDAVNFGLPQHRIRFFFFGIRHDLLANQELVDLTPYLLQRIVPSQLTVSEAISDLPPLKSGEVWQGEYHSTNHPYVERMRRYMVDNELFDHYATQHKEYVIERFKLIPQGQNWQSIRDYMTTTYTKVDNTHNNIYRRLKNDAPAYTIAHYRKSMVIHPLQHRGLSFREACRLQSFPDWFRFNGTRDQQQQQLANAVPPLMANALAWSIGELWLNTHKD